MKVRWRLFDGPLSIGATAEPFFNDRRGWGSYVNSSATDLFHLAWRRTVAVYGGTPQQAAASGKVPDGNPARDWRCTECGAGHIRPLGRGRIHRDGKSTPAHAV